MYNFTNIRYYIKAIQSRALARTQEYAPNYYCAIALYHFSKILEDSDPRPAWMPAASFPRQLGLPAYINYQEI